MTQREEWAHSIARSIEEYIIQVEDANEVPPPLEEAVCKLMQLLARRK